MKKSELTRDKLPMAKPDSIFDVIYWFPNRKKHESGYQMRTVVGKNYEGMFLVSDYCDDLAFRHESEPVKYFSDLRIDTEMN